jgi:hypothetical protein
MSACLWVRAIERALCSLAPRVAARTEAAELFYTPRHILFPQKEQMNAVSVTKKV